MFPNNVDRFVTCSDDGTIIIWDAKTKKHLKVGSNLLGIFLFYVDQNLNVMPLDSKTQDLQDSCKARSVGVSNDGTFIVVGSKDGTVRVFDSDLIQLKFI